jgi:pimeloyl-ACP methyl ester carboxylesterase
MFSDEIAANIAGTRAFARACFARQPPQDAFEEVLAYNMLVPLHVRKACVSRSANPGDLLPGLQIPVLASHGTLDALILPRMSHYTVSQVKDAALSLYEGIGHAPFAEDAPRFNRELAAFVRQCANKSPS